MSSEKAHHVPRAGLVKNCLTLAAWSKKTDLKTLLTCASSAMSLFQSREGRERMGCRHDQLVGALKGGLGLGSGVCVPMELKEKREAAWNCVFALKDQNGSLENRS